MNKTLLLIALLAGVCLQSCVPSNKLYYFHNQQPKVQQIDRAIQSSIQLIKPGDRLLITVSIPDPGQSALLNPFNTSGQGGYNQGGSNQGGSNQGNRPGYLVDKDGNIDFPTIGNIPVMGLTTLEVKDIIRTKLKFLYKDPFVSVNLDSRVYYISGRSGSIIPIVNERLTVFEAIAQCGSQDPYDLRNEMWLVREENNDRTFVQLNLSDSSIFNSPYYYLRSNDLLYMKPGRFSNSFASNSPVGFMLALTGIIVSVALLIRSL